MMKPIEKDYFRWLIAKVWIDEDQIDPDTFFDILRMLHHREFVWVIPNDDNRVADGEDLRLDFLRKEDDGGIIKTRILMDVGVSVLEVLIGISKRLEFNAGGEASHWAWNLFTNLGLHRIHDAKDVDRILDTLIWRTYEKNGLGGFFPLAYSSEDQTKIEIWYQM